jgi:hypothetical protein
MIIRLLFILLIFCTSCHLGEIPCATGKPLKLKKMGHYGINPVKKSRPVASAEKQQTQRVSRSSNIREREVKELASIEDWDCPKPGMNKTPKFVQQNIRANKKKMVSYYKKIRSDSVRMVATH